MIWDFEWKWDLSLVYDVMDEFCCIYSKTDFSYLIYYMLYNNRSSIKPYMTDTYSLKIIFFIASWEGK